LIEMKQDGSTTGGVREGRVLIVDPFPLVHSALATLLRDNGLASGISYAESSVAAMRRYAAATPDVVITDVDLVTKRDGIRLIRKIKNLAASPRILVLSSVNDPDTLADCISSGADSFVHRTARPELLVSAVRKLRQAQPIWYLGVGETADAAVEEDEFSQIVAALTVREREILSLMLMRFSNDEIASRLHLARQTVKNYVSSVLQKLEFASRAELFTSPFGAKYVDVVSTLVAQSQDRLAPVS
jgi:DNA-binding NarL/FixJ family response regulator